MSSSFHNADRRTYRKIMLVGLLFLRGIRGDQLFCKRTTGKYVRSEKGG
jgi:hypothetical protein